MRKMTRADRVAAAEEWGRENAPDDLLDLSIARINRTQAARSLKAAQCDGGGLLPMDDEALAKAKRDFRSRDMAVDMAERRIIKAHEDSS